MLTPSRAHLKRLPNLALRFGARYPWRASTPETLRRTAEHGKARGMKPAARALVPGQGKQWPSGDGAARLGLPIVHLARISHHHHPAATTDPLGLAGRLVLRNPAPRKVQRSSLAARSAGVHRATGSSASSFKPARRNVVEGGHGGAVPPWIRGNIRGRGRPPCLPSSTPPPSFSPCAARRRLGGLATW